MVAVNRSQPSLRATERVRTTSPSVAPAVSSAPAIFCSAARDCVYASGPAALPALSVPVVPDTCTYGPTRTARE